MPSQLCPLLQCALVLCFTLRWDRLGASRTVVCSHQAKTSYCHTWHECPFQREEPPISHSLQSIQISWNRWPASWGCGIQQWWNLIWWCCLIKSFFSRSQVVCTICQPRMRKCRRTGLLLSAVPLESSQNSRFVVALCGMYDAWKQINPLFDQGHCFGWFVACG